MSSPPPLAPTILAAERFTLGKYEVIQRLATGGMAEIFLARVVAGGGISGFEKYVVLKRMLPQLQGQEEFVSMFLDEARLAALLSHPDIVQTYDVGVADGQHFIAMEYVHGEDLRTIMKSVRAAGQLLPREHAVHIVSHICAALHYAHEVVGVDGKPLEIVHRDVSPQNIIATYEGGVKLLDFGIAKSANRYGETRIGTLKGKIGYMSPEQCKGEPLDRRSDVFAAAILLYELAIGKRLYKGQSEFEVLKRIVEGVVPPPSALDPDFPPELERIVLRGLAKDPAQRYQTAREMQLELEEYAREEKLVVSAAALSGFMDERFGRRIEAWREAQRVGKTLAQHLAELPRILEGDPTAMAEAAADDAQPEALSIVSDVVPFALILSEQVAANQEAAIAREATAPTPPLKKEEVRAHGDLLVLDTQAVLGRRLLARREESRRLGDIAYRRRFRRRGQGKGILRARE